MSNRAKNRANRQVSRSNIPEVAEVLPNTEKDSQAQAPNPSGMIDNLIKITPFLSSVVLVALSSLATNTIDRMISLKSQHSEQKAKFLEWTSKPESRYAGIVGLGEIDEGRLALNAASYYGDESAAVAATIDVLPRVEVDRANSEVIPTVLRKNLQIIYSKVEDIDLDLAVIFNRFWSMTDPNGREKIVNLRRAKEWVDGLDPAEIAEIRNANIDQIEKIIDRFVNMNNIGISKNFRGSKMCRRQSSCDARRPCWRTRDGRNTPRTGHRC